VNTYETLSEDIIELIIELLEDKSLEVSLETQLIGDEGILDSMMLVELCLALEDKALEMGFEFDWTSEATLSRSRSMFRTLGSLTNEFIAQFSSSE